MSLVTTNPAAVRTSEEGHIAMILNFWNLNFVLQ
jgi:hypothetical protein